MTSALPDLLLRALAGQSTLPSFPTCATATPIRPATSLVRCGISEVTISTDAAQSAASACAACPAPCSSSVRLSLHQDLACCRPVIEHGPPGPSPPPQASVEQHLEMAAHRPQPLAGQHHKLRGALRGVETDEDTRARGPKQRRQR